MRNLIPVGFLKDADYKNDDGTWTRFPDQLWIESEVKKQTAEQVLILQYKDLLEQSAKMIENTRKEFKKKRSVVEVDSLLESISYFMNHKK